MITVYKYCIEDYKKNVCRVILPIGAQILKIYSNGDKRIDIWAKVDTTAPEEVCYFYVVRTGENITKRLEQRNKSKTLEYIDSFYDKDNIHWHVFKAAGSCKIYWGDNNNFISTISCCESNTITNDNSITI